MKRFKSTRANKREREGDKEEGREVFT